MENEFTTDVEPSSFLSRLWFVTKPLIVQSLKLVELCVASDFANCFQNQFLSEQSHLPAPEGGVCDAEPYPWNDHICRTPLLTGG